MDLLILDLEATCYEQGTEPKGFYSEIIEIGAIEVDTKTKRVGREFNTFVKPSMRVNTYLSSFCKSLTTIKDTDLINAPSLRVALLHLFNTYPLDDMVFASWGDYDKNKLMRDCDKFSLNYPFGFHISLKTAYASFYGIRKCGMDTALQQLGIELEGTHHRGIDDVKNIAKITLRMLEDGWTVGK